MNSQQDVLLLTQRVLPATTTTQSQLHRACWLAFDMLVLTAVVMLLS